jgi:hypothetical protein
MRAGLDENIMTKHDMIQLQRVVSVLNFSIKDLENHIKLIHEAMNLEKAKITGMISQYEDKNSDLMKKIEQHKESLKMDIREMQEEAARWMNEFIGRLEQDIRMSYQSYPFEGIQRHFHFFIMDIMKEAMNECVTAHLEKLSELLKAKSTSLIEDLNLINSTNLAKSTINDVSWTTIDNAVSALSVAGDIIPGLGMLVSLGQLVLGFGKKGMEKDQRNKYIESVLENFPAIKESTFKQISTIYNNIIVKALDILDSTYQKQITASLDAIKQAQVIAESNDQDKKSITEGIEMAATIAREAREKMDQLEAKFAS